MHDKQLIVILGCTATGKTKVAANLAHQINGEVISADSRQVYRGMDVGTGKDISEYTIDNEKIPYHLIDIIDAGEEYNVFNYQQDFLTAYNDILTRNSQPIVCGGTGMYLEAILKGYRMLEVPNNKQLRLEFESMTNDELIAKLLTYRSIHNTTDTIDRDRIIRAIEIAKFEEENKELVADYPQFNAKIFGIQFERSELKKRITARLKLRLRNEEMIAEVEQLINDGVAPEKLRFYGLEYKYLTDFITGKIDRNTLFESLNIAIHQFAKRQATWFRKMERNGFEINWIDGNLPLNEKIEFIRLKISE